MKRPHLAIISSADFEPDGRPEGFIDVTFTLPSDPHDALSAGIYELRFVRVLSEAERDPSQYRAALAVAMPSLAEALCRIRDHAQAMMTGQTSRLNEIVRLADEALSLAQGGRE